MAESRVWVRSEDNVLFNLAYVVSIKMQPASSDFPNACILMEIDGVQHADIFGHMKNSVVTLMQSEDAELVQSKYEKLVDVLGAINFGTPSSPPAPFRPVA